MKIKEITIVNNDNTQRGKSYWFWCPGCKEAHRYEVRTDGGKPTWTFNGDLVRPTFGPSLLMFTTHPESKERKVLCHLFVRRTLPGDEQKQFGDVSIIDYCGDSPHALAGTKVPLPDIPEDSWLVTGV